MAEGNAARVKREPHGAAASQSCAGRDKGGSRGLGFAQTCQEVIRERRGGGGNR